MQMDFCACWAEPSMVDTLETAVRLGVIQFPFALAWAYHHVRPFAQWEELRRPWRHIRPLRAALGFPLLTRRAGRA